MNDYLSSASVVLHVVGKTECLLTEDSRKLLLLLDLLLVKDSAELIECILCVTAERRDILRRILADVDGSLCNGRFCPAARIALNGHGIGDKRNLYRYSEGLSRVMSFNDFYFADQKIHDLIEFFIKLFFR